MGLPTYYEVKLMCNYFESFYIYTRHVRVVYPLLNYNIGNFIIHNYYSSKKYFIYYFTGNVTYITIINEYISIKRYRIL